MKAIFVLLFALFALFASVEARPRNDDSHIQPPANLRVRMVPSPRPKTGLTVIQPPANLRVRAVPTNRPKRGVSVFQPPASMRVRAVPTPRPKDDGGNCDFRWECEWEEIPGHDDKQRICNLKNQCGQ